MTRCESEFQVPLTFGMIAASFERYELPAGPQRQTSTRPRSALASWSDDLEGAPRVLIVFPVGPADAELPELMAFVRGASAANHCMVAR